MSLVTVTAQRYLGVALLAVAMGCGGGNGDDSVDAAVADPCGFSSDRYLPYGVGFTWEYRVTDLASGDVKTKTQTIDSTFTHPDDGLPTFLQRTQKTGGSTENWIRLDGDALIRLRQQDFNSLSELVRTNEYLPSRIRLDESSAAIADGATWDESYIDVEYDPLDVEVARVDMAEHWEVLGVDVPCESPLGSFSCLNLRRTRTAGGIAEKEFMYARGIGKVREDGGQVEQLTGCSVE